MNKQKRQENNGAVNGHKYFECKDGHGFAGTPDEDQIIMTSAARQNKRPTTILSIFTLLARTVLNTKTGGVDDSGVLYIYILRSTHLYAD